METRKKRYKEKLVFVIFITTLLATKSFESLVFENKNYRSTKIYNIKRCSKENISFKSFARPFLYKKNASNDAFSGIGINNLCCRFLDRIYVRCPWPSISSILPRCIHQSGSAGQDFSIMRATRTEVRSVSSSGDRPHGAAAHALHLRPLSIAAN